MGRGAPLLAARERHRDRKSTASAKRKRETLTQNHRYSFTAASITAATLRSGCAPRSCRPPRGFHLAWPLLNHRPAHECRHYSPAAAREFHAPGPFADAQSHARRMKKISPERRQQFRPTRSWRGAPYSVSPTTGHPSAEKCTRIWCVRPVCRSASTASESAQTQAHAPIGARFAAFAAARRHSRAAAQIARDGHFDRSLRPSPSVQQRDIHLLHRGVRETPRPAFCAPHRFARSPSRPMFPCRGDARFPAAAVRPRWISPSSAEAMQQRRDHRAGIGARARMDDHSCGLVYHRDVFVFVEKFERDRLRVPRRRSGGGGFRQLTVSPSSTRYEAFRAAPSTRTRPSSISA